MTCNEAEYAALIFALEQARTFAPQEVRVFSDSKLVIEQMRGWIRVHRTTCGRCTNRRAY